MPWKVPDVIQERIRHHPFVRTAGGGDREVGTEVFSGTYNREDVPPFQGSLMGLS